MLIAVELLQLLIYVAWLALIGQGVLYVLAGANREKNFFYRVLKTIALPAWKLTRLITPKKIPDGYIGWAAFFLCSGLLVGLGLEKAELCTQQPEHPLCVELAERMGKTRSR
jgi:hypothetical protein